MYNSFVDTVNLPELVFLSQEDSPDIVHQCIQNCLYADSLGEFTPHPQHVPDQP